MSIQVIIHPVGGENFSLDVMPTQTGRDIAGLVSTKMLVDPAKITLVYNGKVIDPEITLAEKAIEPFDTIVCVIKQSTTPIPEVKPIPEPTEEVSTVVCSPEELKRVVVVHGLPIIPQSQLEECLETLFGCIAAIERISIQATEGGTQRAFVLLDSEEGAAQAVKLTGTQVAGKSVIIELGVAINGEEEEISDRAYRKFIALVASGYMSGRKGWCKLKENKKAMEAAKTVQAIGAKFMETADAFDKKYHISEKMRQMEIKLAEEMKKLDEKYKIKEKADELATKVKSTDIFKKGKTMFSSFADKASAIASKAAKDAKEVISKKEEPGPE